MSLTLRSAITAAQTTIEVNGADELVAGSWHTIGSETVEIRTATEVTLQPGESAHQIVGVNRGVGGSARATHAAAASVAAYSGGGGGSITATDGTTTVPGVTTLQVVGAGGASVAVSEPVAGTALATVTASGLPSQWTDGGHGDVTATTDDATATPLTVEGFTGQTAPLQQWKDESGTVVASISPTGRMLVAPTEGLANNLIVFQAPVGSSDNDSDLFVVKDEYGVTRLIVTANGGITMSEGAGGEDGFSLNSSTGDVLRIGHVGSENFLKLASGRSFHILMPDGNTKSFEATDVSELGFFGATPVAQPAAPTTLNDVITALQALGLVAS